MYIYIHTYIYIYVYPTALRANPATVPGIMVCCLWVGDRLFCAMGLWVVRCGLWVVGFGMWFASCGLWVVAVFASFCFYFGLILAPFWGTFRPWGTLWGQLVSYGGQLGSYGSSEEQFWSILGGSGLHFGAILESFLVQKAPCWGCFFCIRF